MLINEFDLDSENEFLQETPTKQFSFYWKQVRIIVQNNYVENIVLLMRRGRKGEHRVAQNFTIVIK